MKTKLTFAEMQNFIETVADAVINYGEGRKQTVIDCCVAMYYGEIQFDSDSVEDIYNNQYDLMMSVNRNEIDDRQYEDIIASIDREIDRRTKVTCAKSIMSETNIAAANLFNYITNKLVDVSMAYNIEDTKQMMNAIKQLGENMTADNFVKAMANNGLIDKSKTVKNNGKKKAKNNIEMTTTKDGE